VVLLCRIPIERVCLSIRFGLLSLFDYNIFHHVGSLLQPWHQWRLGAGACPPECGLMVGWCRCLEDTSGSSTPVRGSDCTDKRAAQLDDQLLIDLPVEQDGFGVLTRTCWVELTVTEGVGD